MNFLDRLNTLVQGNKAEEKPQTADNRENHGEGVAEQITPPEQSPVTAKREIHLDSPLIEEILRKLIGRIERNENELNEMSEKIAVLTAVNNELVADSANLREILRLQGEMINKLKSETERLNPVAIPVKSETENSDSEIIDVETDTSEENFKDSETGLTLTELFMLRQGDKIPVRTNINSANRYLHAVSEYENIENYLDENAEYKNFSSYRAVFREFTDSLGKAVNHLRDDIEDSDKDEISVIVTIGVFKVISKHIITRLMPDLHARLSSEHDEKYVNFLRLLNEYLEKAGIYTFNDFSEGDRFTDETAEYFRAVKVPCNESSLDGISAEITMLPYCVSYIEFGERARHYIMGNMKVYSLEKQQ